MLSSRLRYSRVAVVAILFLLSAALAPRASAQPFTVRVSTRIWANSTVFTTTLSTAAPVYHFHLNHIVFQSTTTSTTVSAGTATAVNVDTTNVIDPAYLFVPSTTTVASSTPTLTIPPLYEIPSFKSQVFRQLQIHDEVVTLSLEPPDMTNFDVRLGLCRERYLSCRELNLVDNLVAQCIASFPCQDSSPGAMDAEKGGLNCCPPGCLAAFASRYGLSGDLRLAARDSIFSSSCAQK